MKINEIIDISASQGRSHSYRGNVPDFEDGDDELYQNAIPSEEYIKRMNDTYGKIISDELKRQGAPVEHIRKAVHRLLNELGRDKYDPDYAEYATEYLLNDMGYEVSNDLSHKLGIIGEEMKKIKPKSL